MNMSIDDHGTVDKCLYFNNRLNQHMKWRIQQFTLAYDLPSVEIEKFSDCCMFMLRSKLPM